MFCKRFTAYCLLLLHGVLAAVGPYWHHHRLPHVHEAVGCCVLMECPANCCGLLDSSSQDGDSDRCGASHTDQTASHTDQTSTLEQACQSVGADDCQPLEPSNLRCVSTALDLCLTTDGHHGPCAICDYFAQAQDVEMTNQAPSPAELAMCVVEHRHPMPSFPLTHCQARGPPCCT